MCVHEQDTHFLVGHDNLLTYKSLIEESADLLQYFFINNLILYPPLVAKMIIQGLVCALLKGYVEEHPDKAPQQAQVMQQTPGNIEKCFFTDMVIPEVMAHWISAH